MVVTDKQLADPQVPGKITERGVRDNITAYVSSLLPTYMPTSRENIVSRIV